MNPNVSTVDFSLKLVNYQHSIFTLILVFQADFAVFSKVDIQTRAYDYQIVELMGRSVSTNSIDIDTYAKYNYRQWKWTSFVDARNHFRQLCVHLQHYCGYYRMKIVFQNANHLQYIRAQPKSQLNESVSKFLERMIDRYLPLGVPKYRQINEALTKLSEILRVTSEEPKDEETLEKRKDLIIYLSNTYYEMMAHPSGRGQKQTDPNPNQSRKINCRPPVHNIHLLTGKIEHVNIQILFIEAVEQGIQTKNLNPLDYIYHKYLSVNLWPINSGTWEYCQFISYFRLISISNRLRSVFNVDKREWAERFRRDIGNQRYLFHSTHSANLVNILKNGLQIAPNHVFSYNRWAGKGIYFHDRVDAAHSYARRLNHHIILVCYVALGNMEIIENCQFNKNPNYTHPLPWNKQSLKQLGTGRSSFEQYDEFIVQNEDQVKIEFILELSGD